MPNKKRLEIADKVLKRIEKNRKLAMTETEKTYNELEKLLGGNDES